MIRVTARFAVMYVLTVSVALVLTSSPAMAGPYEDMWAIVARAGTENHEAITTFINEASGAQNVSQLDAALDKANRTLDDILRSAAFDIEVIRYAHPEYEEDAQEALGQLDSDHNAAHAEASYTYQLFYDALNSTTTTTSPPTTTTTTEVPDTTTTTEVPETTTTTEVPDTTTTTEVTETTTTVEGTTDTVPPPTTTTTSPSSTTSTTSAGAIPPVDAGPPSGNSAFISDDPTAVMTAPSIWTLADTAGGTSGEAGESTGPMSSVMSNVSQVLPPALAQFTVAPFIVVEILVATLFESTKQMAVPMLLIIAVMAGFVWLENRRYSDSLSS